MAWHFPRTNKVHNIKAINSCNWKYIPKANISIGQFQLISRFHHIAHTSRKYNTPQIKGLNTNTHIKFLYLSCSYISHMNFCEYAICSFDQIYFFFFPFVHSRVPSRYSNLLQIAEVKCWFTMLKNGRKRRKSIFSEIEERCKKI